MARSASGTTEGTPFRERSGSAPGDVPDVCGRKSPIALQPVSVNRRPPRDVLLHERKDRRLFDIRDDRHANPTRDVVVFLHCDQYQSGLSSLQLAAAARSPGCGPPTHVSSNSTSLCKGSRATFTIARRSLWSIIHAVSYRRSDSWRCSSSAEIARLSVVIK